KTLVTLLPCESLFLGSGDDLTIAQQTCGAVVVERRYPEYELRCHWQPLIRRWSESSSRSRNAASRRPRSRHRAGKTQTVTRRAITGCKRSSSGVRDRARGTVMLRCYHSNARSPLRRGAIARLSIVTSRARIRICSRGMSATLPLRGAIMRIHATHLRASWPRSLLDETKCHGSRVRRRCSAKYEKCPPPRAVR